MPLQLSMNSQGAKPVINIPKKTTGLFGKALGVSNTAPAAKSYDMSQYGQSKIPTPAPVAPKPVEHPTASTPVKKQTTPDGTVTEYHAPPKETTIATAPKTTATSVVAPKSAVPVQEALTYKGFINSLGNQGQSDYNVSAKKNIGLVSDTAQGNRRYADKAQNIVDAAGQKISDIGGQGARGAAGYLTTGTSPVAEGNAAILAQTTAAQQRAVAEGANMQLAGNSQGLQAQSQEQSGYGTAANQALTGQSTAQGALGTAAGYMQPTSNIILRDPTTGEVIGDQNLETLAAKQGRLSGIESGASSAASALGGSQAALTQAYQQGQAQLRAADNIEPQIVQTLISNPTLNSTPISALTNLNQWFSGQTSQPEQQVLAKQVASYITTLGMSPDEAAQIATQKGGTIGTLLKTLKDIAVAKNEANNPANINVPGSSGGGKTFKSNSGNTYTLPY